MKGEMNREEGLLGRIVGGEFFFFCVLFPHELGVLNPVS